MESKQQLFFPEDRSAERLDCFLAESFPEISRSQIKKLISTDLVSIAGVAVKAGFKLKGGELIDVCLPAPQPIEALPESIPLKILYEDHDLVVVDKEAGMVVHPAAGHFRGTLVNALLDHCGDLAGIGGELRPGIVHRIDKDTSGVLVVTKNDQSHQHLAAQFKKHSVKRRYIALVFGQMLKRQGTIDSPIGRHTVDRKKMSSATRQGKHAVTHWKLIRWFESDRISLLELTLETGRTHQIRVHLSEMKFPLVADPVYGNPSQIKMIKDSTLRSLMLALKGQALHAAVLGFVHPRQGEYMEFKSELPNPFKAIIEYLEHKNLSEVN